MKTSTMLLLATSLALSLACGGSGGPSLVLTPRADLMVKCDDGDMEACADLGADLTIGTSGPKNDQAAVTPLVTACDGGVARACAVLGASSRVDPIQLPPGRTEESLYRRGCELGYSLSCSEWGRTIYNTQGSTPQAISAFRTGCNGDDEGGCLALAALTLAGQGIPKDPTEGQRLMKRACDLDSGDACFRLSKLVQADSPQEAVKLKKKACDLGFSDACS